MCVKHSPIGSNFKLNFTPSVFQILVSCEKRITVLNLTDK